MAGCQGPHDKMEAIATSEGVMAAAKEPIVVSLPDYVDTIRKDAIRQFSTGATRDTDRGKFAYEGFLCPFVLTRFGEYMHNHRIQSDGSVRDADNWQKGIPIEAYKDSLIRHVIDAWRVFRGEAPMPKSPRDPEGLEELLCAIMFNSMGYLHEMLKAKREFESTQFDKEKE